MQKLSEILQSKTYVGKSFSLQAKIILSKTSDLLKNTIKDQKNPLLHPHRLLKIL